MYILFMDILYRLNIFATTCFTFHNTFISYLHEMQPVEYSFVVYYLLCFIYINKKLGISYNTIS